MAKVALLIGVSEYELGLSSLPAATKDVEALCRVLKDPDLGGFDEVKSLINPKLEAMQDEIETLFTGRAKDDLVLLYFSGHGINNTPDKIRSRGWTKKAILSHGGRQKSYPSSRVQVEQLHRTDSLMETIVQSLLNKVGDFANRKRSF